MGLIRDVGQIIIELAAGFSRKTILNFYFYVHASINSEKSWAAKDVVYLAKMNGYFVILHCNLNYHNPLTI